MRREKARVYIYTRVSTAMQNFGVNLICVEVDRESRIRGWKEAVIYTCGWAKEENTLL